MKKRQILSLVIALAMTFSAFTGMTTVSAAADNHWTDTFEENADVVATAGTQVNDNWKLSNVGGDGHARIFMNHLLISGNLRSTTPTMVTSTAGALEMMPAENTMTFKLGKANDRVANRGELDNNSSTTFARFAMSDDGSSYYEIGMTGTSTSWGLSRSNYPLPAEIGGASNYYPDSIDYAGRWYFRKVVGGNTTYIEWENADDGIFEISKNADVPKTRRVVSAYATWDQKVSTLGTNDTATETYNPATVSVKTTKSGVEFSVSVNKLYGRTDEESSLSNHSVTWTSSYADAAPLARKGAKIAFGACGDCGGLILDDLDFAFEGELTSISHWRDSFDTDTEKVRMSGSPINENWMAKNVASLQYARIYNGSLSVFGVNDSTGKTIVAPSARELKSLPAENTMSFTMGGAIDHGATNSGWANYSTMFTRFGMSKDGASYYEIGMTGTSGDALTRYPIPTVVGGANASGSEYLGRWYFQKIENGETVYIEWENAPGGVFEMTQNSDVPVLRRLFASCRTFKTAINNVPEGTYPEDHSNTPARVKVETTETGVNYEVVCNNVYGRTNEESARSTHNGVTWTGSYEDASPLARVGAGFEFGAVGSQSGFMVDDLDLAFQGELKAADAPDFEERFMNYNSSNAVTSAYRLINGEAVLAEHESGAKWVTSTTFKGCNEVDFRGSAYVDANNHRLVMSGLSFYYPVMVKLDMNDVKVDRIKKVEFTTSHDNALGTEVGIGMFVGGQDKNFLLFSQAGRTKAFGGDMNVPSVRLFTDEKYGAFVSGGMDEGIISNWSENDTITNWTVEIDENNVITWTAVGNGGGRSSGIIDDAEVKELIEKNWGYPVAALSGGDYANSLTSLSMWYDEGEPLTYEKRAYTYNEMTDLYESAKYYKDSAVEDLIKLDLSNVKVSTDNATVTVDSTTSALGSDLVGAQVEFRDDYNIFYDENGNLLSSYVAYAQNRAPISSFRFGGGSSTMVNMLKTIYHEPSTYISLPGDYNQELLGKEVSPAYNMGLLEWIKALSVNNPNASYVLCVSMLTTTPEETRELIHILRDTTGTYANIRKRAGIENPVNIRAIELTNEIDVDSAQRRSWYTTEAAKHIAKIKQAESETGYDVKIMACGPTAAWDSTDSRNRTAWVRNIAQNIGADIDEISYHPYYYGIKPANLLNVSKQYIKDILDANGASHVKVSLTEHSVYFFENYEGMDRELSVINNSSLWASLGTAYFVQKAADTGYISSAYYHNLISKSQMYARWQKNADSFYINPVTKMYDTLTNAVGEEQYNTSVAFAGTPTSDHYWNTGSTDTRFDATAVKSARGEMKLVLTNSMPYTDINLTFNLPSEYTLTNETVFTAPNMFSFAYNENTSDVSTVTSTDKNIENFSSYKMPSKSMVVLTLRTADGTVALSDDFTEYQHTEFVGDDEYADIEDAEDITSSVLCENSNGTKWVTDAEKTGLFEYRGENYFGDIDVSNRGITVTTMNDDSDEIAANWDITGYNGDAIESISEITFTTNGTNGGVRLFVNADGNSAADLSTNLAGNVNWIITVNDGVASWVADNGSSTNSGSFTLANDMIENSKYFAQVYANGDTEGNSMTLSYISARYVAGDAPAEKDLIEYAKKANLEITVNPKDAAGVVFVGYYNNNGKLIKLSTVNEFAANGASRTFTSDLPQAGQSAKIFVWDSLTNMTPICKAIAVQ